MRTMRKRSAPSQDAILSAGELPPQVEATLQSVAERQLLRPLLLLLVGHRPLAFMAGQCLLLALPLEMLCTGLPIRAWAEVLNHADGPALLERRLQLLLG